MTNTPLPGFRWLAFWLCIMTNTAKPERAKECEEERYGRKSMGPRCLHSFPPFLPILQTQTQPAQLGRRVSASGQVFSSGLGKPRTQQRPPFQPSVNTPEPAALDIVDLPRDEVFSTSSGSCPPGAFAGRPAPVRTCRESQPPRGAEQLQSSPRLTGLARSLGQR